MTVVERALEIATKGHAGVFRWDRKTPYIEHPKAVAEYALNMNDQFGLSLNPELLYVSCILHDLVEDVEVYLDQEDKLAAEVYTDSVSQWGRLKDILWRLNKHRHADYLAFVLAAKANPYARVVKVADITHNLSNLTKGSMKEKYELALYILQS